MRRIYRIQLASILSIFLGATQLTWAQSQSISDGQGAQLVPLEGKYDTTPPPPSADDLIQRGDAACIARRDADAIEAYRHAVSLLEKSPTDQMRLAKVLLKLVNVTGSVHDKTTYEEVRALAQRVVSLSAGVDPVTESSATMILGVCPVGCVIPKAAA